MKTLKTLIFVSLIALTGLAGCSKDDDASNEENQTTNSVKFNDQSFTWNDNAELWYYSNSQCYEMSLFTGSLRVENKLTGKGDWLVIDFYSSTAGTLKAGDYAISDSENEGTCTIDFNFDTDATGQYLNIGSTAYFTSGKVTVKGSDDKFTVTFDGTDDDGNKLKGTVTSKFALVYSN